jgi:thioesterase domain-containing protein
MADLYLAALREVQPDGPYLLGGWSMGSLVAFELACRLARDGHAPAALILLDPPRPPRHSQPGGELASEESLLAAFAHDLAGLSGTAESVAAPPERGVDSLDESLRPLFTTFRRNVRAMESFRPSIYPGRVHLLFAEQGGVDQGTGQSADRGWSPLAAGGLEVASVPGDHYSMLREPHAGALAERLADLLAGAETARTTDPDRVRRTP